MSNIYSVKQINSYIKNMFAQDCLLGLVSVSGEISTLKYHSSGHIYFTLMEDNAAIKCVMFAGNRNGLDFKLEEGMSIVVTGSVSIYERDGSYQLYARKIKLAGIGDLAEKFEALKQKLEDMGMFASEYKQPIPEYIHTLGVVTAPTGAAIHDIINVSRRRNPYINIILYPAQVQGDGAAKSIIDGIEALEKYGVDTIIVGRGGGSREDLWCFNDEKLAEAIFNCMTPVISAVGHEIDFTISDFVADVRAATPSQAAEIAVADYYKICERLDGYYRTINRELDYKLDNYRHRLEKVRTRLEKLSVLNKTENYKTRLKESEDKIYAVMTRNIVDAKHRLEMTAERLEGVSPVKRLSGGYVYMTDKDGKAATDAGMIHKGDSLKIRMRNGRLDVTVTEVEKDAR